MEHKPKVGEKFIDKFGDVWVYIGDWSVRRERDGNIGTWASGQGLKLYKGAEHIWS